MGKQVVLVADDEKNVRLLVRELLGGKLSIIEAKNGAEAVDMARRHKPDLILMDIMMPDMDGYQACLDIKKDELIRSTPVVMVSGAGYELNKRLAKDVGANDYVTKPFTQKQLLEAISNFVNIPK